MEHSPLVMKLTEDDNDVEAFLNTFELIFSRQN